MREDDEDVRVFLSHASQDKPLAGLVRRQLQECGFEVWSDERIRVGESIAEQVAQGINTSDAFVVILGKGSADRQWTSLEIGGAVASGRPIVPVIADREARMPLLLGDVRALDLSDPAKRQDQLPGLCEALRDVGRATRTSSSARELVQRASEELGWEASRYRSELARRDARQRRLQLVAAAVSMGAAVVALVTIASDVSAVVSSIASGLVGVLGFTVGYYFAMRDPHIRGPERSRHVRETDEVYRP